VTGVQTCALPISPKPQNPIASEIINKMSLLIGKSAPRVRINKFIIFEMLGFVFKDFQIFELLLKLSRGSYKLAVGNQVLLKRMC